jgi:tetratricopeptide (TPR) repeat protein
MPAVPTRKRSRTPYWLRFTLVLLSLGGITSTFVLVVLPRRFVLQSGLVESGVTFPTREPPFEPPQSRPVTRPAGAAQPEGVQLGPAESFWNNATPLMETGRYTVALPLFREYLSHYPDDMTAWQEYAVTLIRSGRSEDAERVYRSLLAHADDSHISLELARLLRDRGSHEEAIVIYRNLLDRDPDDLGLRHELAQTLSWAGAYRDAIGEYRHLLAQAPDDYGYRVELVRVLYWDDLPIQAFALLTGFPSDVAEYAEATALRTFLDSVIHASLPPGMSTVERARQAAAKEDLVRARVLYERALRAHHDDPGLWLEWIDFLQYRASDLKGARTAFTQLAQLRNLTLDERFRTAQLDVWTGNEQDAKTELQRLVEEDPHNSEAWTLLGDLYFWQGSRIAAADAYGRALELSPTNGEAEMGLRAVRRQTVALVAARENPDVGPHLFYFEDSDGFRRIDLTVEATLLRSVTGAVVRAGYRRIEGTGLSGSPSNERGPFIELEVVQWWRFGTVRTSLAAGVEQLDASGSVPIIEAGLDIPNIRGTALTAHYTHGRAFPQTLTYESVEASLLSDYAEVSAYRQLGERWSLSGNSTLASLHGAGPGNLRLTMAAFVSRQWSSLLSAGLTTQLLTLSDAAPGSSGRRLYWDPVVFWANGVQVEFKVPIANDWEVYARLTPGIALDNERHSRAPEWVPQLGAAMGIGFQTRRMLFSGDLAYSRGREGGYNSFGANVLVAIRY